MCLKLQKCAWVFKSGAGAQCAQWVWLASSWWCFMGEIWARNDNFTVLFITKTSCNYKNVLGFLKAGLVWNSWRAPNDVLWEKSRQENFRYDWPKNQIQVHCPNWVCTNRIELELFKGEFKNFPILIMCLQLQKCAWVFKSGAGAAQCAQWVWLASSWWCFMGEIWARNGNFMGPCGRWSVAD